MSLDVATEHTIEEGAAAAAAILAAVAPLTGPAAPALLAIAPAIPALVLAILSAIDGGATGPEAVAALLAQTTSLDPGPVSTRLDAADAAAVAALRAHAVVLAQTVQSLGVVSPAAQASAVHVLALPVAP